MGSLIEEIRSGNKEAVKAVYQEYAKDVYNFAKSITGDHDSALAATKKTFVKLFNNIKRGENPDNIRTALLKVAYDEACALAMPEGNKQPIQEAPLRSAAAPQARNQRREDIYVPKGGMKSLQVEENDLDEEQEETPAPRRPMTAAPQRRRRPVMVPENDVIEEEPVAEVQPVVVPVAQSVDFEEEEEVKPVRGRKKPVEDDFYDDEEDYEEEYEEKPRKKKPSKSKKRRNDYDDEEDVDVYDPLKDEDDYEEDEEYVEKKPKNKGLFIFCIILNIVLILILLWFLCGLLINLSVLPEFDLGYAWFNSHIYPLF